MSLNVFWKTFVLYLLCVMIPHLSPDNLSRNFKCIECCRKLTIIFITDWMTDVGGTSHCYRAPVTSFRCNSDQHLHLCSQTRHGKESRWEGAERKRAGVDPQIPIRTWTMEKTENLKEWPSWPKSPGRSQMAPERFCAVQKTFLMVFLQSFFIALFSFSFYVFIWFGPDV